MKTHGIAKTAGLALAGLALVLPAAERARAADVALTSPQPAIDWNGLYLGGFAGAVHSVIQASAFRNALDVPFQSFSCTGGLCDGRRDGFLGGVTLGFNKHYADGTLLGVEGDIAFSNLDDDLDYNGILGINALQRVNARGNVRLDTPFFSTLRLRAGYAIGRFLPFVTAGVAVTYSTLQGQGANVLEAQTAPGVWTPVGAAPVNERVSAWASGWTAGGGFEYAISDHWSAKADYLYVDLITSNLGEEPPKHHLMRAGLNYRF